MPEFTLPEDPKPGEILEIPEGREDENHSQVLTLYQGTVCVGFTEGVDRVANVSGAIELRRCTTSKELKVGEILEIRTEVTPIASYVFVNFFGWQVHSYQDTTSTEWSQRYRIEHLAQVPHKQSPQSLYERVCLQAIEGDKK